MSEQHIAHSEEVHDEHHFEIVEHGVHIVHSSKKEIWKVFFILLAITILEFLIALTPSIRQHISREVIIGIFFILTVFKAFYIVGYFMHLKHEKLNMAYTILVPLMFIAYLIALLMFEGGAQ
jgi:cytochrome c oxidase subunit 4